MDGLTTRDTKQKKTIRSSKRSRRKGTDMVSGLVRRAIRYSPIKGYSKPVFNVSSLNLHNSSHTAHTPSIFAYVSPNTLRTYGPLFTHARHLL